MHRVVIGLGYGDEGKGSIVDYLTWFHGAKVNLRFNGGPNAAHHVKLPNSVLHCFSQYCSGMLNPGVSTYLSEYMLVDPFSLLVETERLIENGTTSPLERIIFNGESIIIVPMHWQINQMREVVRGRCKHGSVGVGVGEAFHDSQTYGHLVLRLKDLLNVPIMKKKLSWLYEEKTEIATKLLSEVPDDEELLTISKGLFNAGYVKYLIDVYQKFADHIKIDDRYLSKQNEQGSVVCEGAQGTLLDPIYGFAPHVTKTRTTLANADVLIGRETDRRVIGILRAYFTRHGNGPFVTEKRYLRELIRDPNNSTNPWQGEFRFGWFDLVAARYAIYEANHGKIDELAVTCLDDMADFSEIRVCTSYEYNGVDRDNLDEFFEWDRHNGAIRIKAIKKTSSEERSLIRTKMLRQCTPFEYELFPSWKIVKITKKLRLPRKAINYLDYLSSNLGLPITIASVGPTRLEKIELKPG